MYETANSRVRLLSTVCTVNSLIVLMVVVLLVVVVVVLVVFLSIMVELSNAQQTSIAVQHCWLNAQLRSLDTTG